MFMAVAAIVVVASRQGLTIHQRTADETS